MLSQVITAMIRNWNHLAGLLLQILVMAPS